MVLATLSYCVVEFKVCYSKTYLISDLLLLVRFLWELIGNLLSLGWLLGNLGVWNWDLVGFNWSLIWDLLSLVGNLWDLVWDLFGLGSWNWLLKGWNWDLVRNLLGLVGDLWDLVWLLGKLVAWNWSLIWNLLSLIGDLWDLVGGLGNLVVFQDDRDVLGYKSVRLSWSFNHLLFKGQPKSKFMRWVDP